jgi:hypothetical protein
MDARNLRRRGLANYGPAVGLTCQNAATVWRRQWRISLAEAIHEFAKRP